MRFNMYASSVLITTIMAGCANSGATPSRNNVSATSGNSGSASANSVQSIARKSKREAGAGLDSQPSLTLDPDDKLNPDFSELFNYLIREKVRWSGATVSLREQIPRNISKKFDEVAPSPERPQYRIETRGAGDRCSGGERRVYLVPAEKYIFPFKSKTSYAFTIDVVFDGADTFDEGIRKLSLNSNRDYGIPGINIDLDKDGSPSGIQRGLAQTIKLISGECKIKGVRVGRVWKAWDYANLVSEPSKKFMALIVTN